MTQPPEDLLNEVLAPAMAYGGASRSELLTAAVSARAPTPVIQALLELPEGNYNDLDDLRGVLPPSL